jgi:hypothetical protein
VHQCEAIRANAEGVIAGSTEVEPSVKEFKEVMVLCPKCDIPSELLDSLREFGQEWMRINVLLDIRLTGINALKHFKNKNKCREKSSYEVRIAIIISYPIPASI